MQGAGYWLNPNTGKCVRITTHDEWVRDWANAQSIGLPKAAYDAIMKHPPTAVDEIRIVAIESGLVRIREHPRYTSVQFSAHAHQIKQVLQAIIVALTELKMHPDTTLVIDNLLLNYSASLSVADLKSRLDNDQPVFREDK